MNVKKVVIAGILVLASLTFIGCSPINDVMVKLGLKNNAFNYIKEQNVSKIVIQNNRDPGFRFIITDPKAINQIYETLADGSVRKEKVNLEPDYIFEIYAGNEVKKYDYVVGVDESGKGDFFDNTQAFQVPKNLEDTIIGNLSFVRKPNDFNEIYYESLMKVINETKHYYDKSGHTVGIDLLGDVNCVQYLYSMDIQNFINEVKKEVPSAGIINGDFNKYNVIISADNRGYNNTVFKTIITLDDIADRIYQQYYVIGTYDYGKWNIQVSKPNQMPNNWYTVGTNSTTNS